jgi:tetratricopeptide (TPR) repeat protein
MSLAALGLQLWVFLFLGFFGSELLAAEPGLRIATQVLFGLPLAVWAVLRLRGPFRPIDWAIGAALVALTITALFSADRQGSLDSVGLAIAWALLFWAMRDIGQSERLRRAVAVAGAYAFVLWLVLAAGFWIAEKVAWIQAVGGVPNLESAQVFIWGTANAFPIMSLLAAGFLVALPAGRARRLLWIVWAGASIVVVPLSAGRAGWLGIVMAAIAFEAFRGWPLVRGAASWLRSRGFLAPALGVAGLAAVVVGAVIVIRGADPSAADLATRFRIWNEGLAMLAADPLTGGGPTTFSWLRLTHVPDYGYAVPVRLAHNVVVQTLADGGLLLGAAFASLLAVLAVTLWHGRRRLGAAGRAWAAIMLGYGAAALLDDFSSLPAIIAAVVILAAWAVAAAEGPGKVAEPARLQSLGRFGLPALVALLALGIGPSLVGMESARLVAADARQAALDDRWPEAEAAFRSAVDRYPGNAGYRMGLGLALARLGRADEALSQYEWARDLSPGDARAWGGVAALTEDAASRVELLDAASRRTSTDPQYAFRLGGALADTPDRAVDAFALATVIDPSRILAVPAAVRSEVEARVPSLVESLSGVIPLEPDAIQWDLGLADGTLPADAGPAWRAVAAAESGDWPRARGALREAREAAPYASRTLLATAAVARVECDRATYDAARSVIGVYRPPRTTELAITRDYPYRDQGLGSYQPMAEPPYPQPAEWPWSLVGDPPACPGW